ncbi:adenylyltransferase/cytidyltransferase family protein [Jeotgalibacillus aurantiacus]|uniref:adenylyltransferase/cytidyltransferase family protein n=1 Tax=Jeotgalibacillus aurantiacus TaxID=2763266 RepID=UPI001D0BD508|nr:adenylyltransferase/cytidyltransferase family protein [Jeotgalibacillus aurantiacus]
MKQYKIGYTTGVFDLFHVGHLNILRQAKEQCDHLIVGVSTDELVQQYKNKTPVITHEDRMAIVQSIKYVDEVVPQVTRDKLAAWHELGFDVMFVGDDWKGNSLFLKTEMQFREFGVQVVYFPYTPHVSSTIVKKKIEIL